MPIPLHLTLLILTSIVALLGGFMLGMSGYESLRPSLPDVLQEKIAGFIVFGLLPAALSILLTRFVFRYLIAGRCPRCGGRAIYRHSGSRKNVFGVKQSEPITYHCRECGHVHRTRIFSPNPQIPD